MPVYILRENLVTKVCVFNVKIQIGYLMAMNIFYIWIFRHNFYELILILSEILILMFYIFFLDNFCTGNVSGVETDLKLISENLITQLYVYWISFEMLNKAFLLKGG